MTLNNFDDFEAQRDLSKNREVFLEDGSKMFIRQEEQHGFWHIKNSKGKVAAKLSGTYTTFEQALRALTLYAANDIKKPIKEVNRGFGIVTDKHGQLVNKYVEQVG